LDRSSLALDVTDFLAHYAGQPLDQFDLGGALKEITELIRHYNIMLPARIAMLIKALITLEGTAQLVSPKFSLIEMMKPYRTKILWRRFSPRRRLRKMRRFMAEIEHVIELLPAESQRYSSKSKAANSMSTSIIADWNRRLIAWCWECLPAHCFWDRPCF